MLFVLCGALWLLALAHICRIWTFNGFLLGLVGPVWHFDHLFRKRRAVDCHRPELTNILLLIVLKYYQAKLCLRAYLKGKYSDYYVHVCRLARDFLPSIV